MIPFRIKNKTKFLKSSKIVLHVCQSILLHDITYLIQSGAFLDDPKKTQGRYRQTGFILKLIIM